MNNININININMNMIENNNEKKFSRLPTRLNKKRNVKFTAQLNIENVDWSKVDKIFASDRQYYLHQLSKKRLINPKTKEILFLLAGGAVFGFSLFVPSLPAALALLFVSSNKFNKKYYKQTIDRLKNQKLVDIVEENGSTIVKITDKGRVRALRYKLSEVMVKKPKFWDKKWRVVIFDIPEKHKRMREIFRKHLQIMGFHMLQKSVWVHPYPCFNEIEFLRQIYSVGINVTYLVAEKIEEAQDLRTYYHL